MGDPLRNDALGNFAEHQRTVDRIVDEAGAELIAIIQGLQAVFGFVPRDALTYVSQRLGIGLAQIYGVITFYPTFSLKARGKYVLKVCTGTACYVSGASRITDALADRLQLAVGETTPERDVSLETVACVGCCSLAPVVMVNERAHGRLSRDSALEMLGQYRQPRAET